MLRPYSTWSSQWDKDVLGMRQCPNHVLFSVFCTFTQGSLLALKELLFPGDLIPRASQ